MSIGMRDNGTVGRLMVCAADLGNKPEPRKRRVMPASEKRVAANRRNARKSTGPRTDVGKSASSMNAVTHGVCSQRPVLPTEDSLAFDTFTMELEEEMRPRTVIQRMLFPRIVGLLWRLRRIEDAEVHLFSKEAEKAPNADGDASRILAERFSDDPCNGFTQLARYERGLQAQLTKLLKHFGDTGKAFGVKQYDEVPRRDYLSKRPDSSRSGDACVAVDAQHRNQTSTNEIAATPKRDATRLSSSKSGVATTEQGASYAQNAHETASRETKRTHLERNGESLFEVIEPVACSAKLSMPNENETVSGGSSCHPSDDVHNGTPTFNPSGETHASHRPEDHDFKR